MIKKIGDLIDSYRYQLLVIPWLATLAIIGGSLLPGSTVAPVFIVSDKLIHAACYAIAMISFAPFYYYTVYRDIALRLAAMGVLLEFAQGVFGLRTFDAYDMLANVAGLFCAWLLMRYWYHPQCEKQGP